ncbi:MAG: response regulator transcription factor [Vicinamibacterales bacterium]
MHARTSPPRRLRLLVVEDETNIRDLLCLHFESEGHHCLGAASGREGLGLLRCQPFDVVVLDVMLPEMGGLEVCQRLRAGRSNQDVPVLMLTARSDETDKLAGFGSGADDYLTKPFSIRELSARVDALTRRQRATSRDARERAQVVERPGIRLDVARRTLHVNGREVSITPHEFRLFYLLAASPGVVFSREHLLEEVWQGEVFVTGRSVDTLVHRLRCKIERDPGRPRIILTVWGEGYKCAE